MGIGLHVQNNILFYLLLVVVGFGGFIFPILFPVTNGFYAFIIASAIAGFGVAANIFRAKRSHKQLVCPAGSNCNVVINSKYSVFLGVPIEYFGMAYYVTIVTSYVAFLLVPEIIPPLASLSVVLISFCAFLFSLYLLVAQAFLLRQWCIWCLLSALMSIAIFITALVSVPLAVEVLERIFNVLLVVHSIGFMIGVGSATVAAFLFVRFLRDFKISPQEMGIIKGIAELSWLGLATIFMSELAMYLTQHEIMAASELFWIKTLALFVAAIVGAVLMIVLEPFLSVVPFVEGDPPSMLVRIRRYIIVAGSIALSSWYFAFVATLIAKEYSFLLLLVAYGIYMCFAIVAGLLLEQMLLGSKKEIVESMSSQGVVAVVEEKGGPV